MRVIAGIHRSRQLIEVDSKNTRETKDRVKESIFNSISLYLHGSRVLDLFSGSGSLGIEALSRGAYHCVFNDYSRQAIDVTNKNIEQLRLQNLSTVFQLSHMECLNRLEEEFDVILLDPPYPLHVFDEILEFIGKKKLLSRDGIIVLLYNKDRELHTSTYFTETKTKTIGITKVSYMKWS